MNAAPGEDRIDVTLALSEGRVETVAISARRPVGVGRLAQGRDGDAVAALIPRLFALCARAQGAAVASALAAARGSHLPEDARVAQAGAVLAERLCELLRGSITALAGASLPVFVPALRQVIDASRAFDGVKLPGTSAIASIEAGLGALGLPEGCCDDDKSYRRWLSSESPLAQLLRPSLMGDGAFGAIALCSLSAADDVRIGEALRRDGAHFAVRPDLDGQVPETGAWARNAGHPLLAALGGGLTARLVARLIEIRAAPAQLRALLRGDAPPAELITSSSLAPGVGLGAVECARGRLHHLVALNPHGHVDRLEILAPTEWNFHPRGALFRALTGIAWQDGGAAFAQAKRLVAAFDPCVAFNVEITEAAHA